LIERALKSGKSSLQLTEDIYETHFFTILLRKFNPYFEAFTEKLHQMISVGIPQKHKDNKNNRYGQRDRKDEISGPPVLTVDDLHVGFLVCSILGGISFIVFIIEFGLPRLKMIVKIISESILATIIVRAFLNMKFR